MPCNVWNEIIYPFPNFSICTVEVWQWLSDFIPHILMGVITYLFWDKSWCMLVKGATGLFYLKTHLNLDESYNLYRNAYMYIELFMDVHTDNWLNFCA